MDFSENLLAFIEFLPEATFIIGQDGTVVAWNHAVEELTSVSSESIVGKKDRAYSIPFYGKPHNMLADKVLQLFLHGEPSKKPSNHSKHRLVSELFAPNLNGGSYLWAIAGPLYDLDGTFVGAIETIQDITSRVEAEMMIAQSEEKYSMLFHQSQDAIILHDLDGKISEVNDKAVQLFNYNHMELLELNFQALDKTNALVKDDANKSINSGRAECILLKKNEEEIIADISSSVIDYESNQLVQRIIRDNTEKRKKEQEARKLEQILIQTQKESLEEKDILLKEIHHRVKNNMQIIVSLLNLQSKKFKDPEIKGILLKSQNRVKSMSLIHEMLYRTEDFSDINYKKYVEQLVTSLLQSYGVDAKKIKMTYEIPDINLNMNCAVPVALITNEIISNCLKYAFPEGKSGEIKVVFRPVGEEYELEISDNGIGIPENVSSESRKTLGMHLVSLLVRQLDGTLNLQKKNPTRYVIRFNPDVK